MIVTFLSCCAYYWLQTDGLKMVTDVGGGFVLAPGGRFPSFQAVGGQYVKMLFQIVDSNGFSVSLALLGDLTGKKRLGRIGLGKKWNKPADKEEKETETFHRNKDRMG